MDSDPRMDAIMRQQAQLKREAQAVQLTANLLRSQGFDASIGVNNETGQALMQTGFNVAPDKVLEAIARSWVMMGEPTRKLACINHFAQPQGRIICKLRTCAEIVASPNVGCGM
jgi:hypothetical protein